MIKICEYCKSEFDAKRKARRFCNTKCSNGIRKTKTTKQCLVCNSDFTTIPSQVKLGGGKYCSTKCSDIGHRKDDKPVKDRRKTKAYKEWKLGVLARDNWTCQKCTIRGGKLHVHHIFAYAKHKELRTVVSNGITFCEKCHSDFHKKYGKINFKDKDTYEFIQ